MDNKMATPLKNFFFNNKKMTPQCNDGTLGSTVETLVIQFDQEKFELLLSEGGSSPTTARKHKKISVVRSPLTTVEKQVSDETKKAIYRTESTSYEAKQTSLKSVLVSTETQITRANIYALRAKLK